MSDDKKFDPMKRNKLNDPLRLKWVPPGRIVDLMDLKEGGEYVDLGAGTGYISRAIGELVDAPVIHAVDIEPLMVEEMNSILSDVAWIKPALMERDKLPFADSSIDGLWGITVFHEFGAPKAILTEIHRVLKPGGRALVIEYHPFRQLEGRGARFTAGDGAEVLPINLISQDGLHWMIEHTIENFTSFAPLGTVMVAMLGIGVAEKSGLIGTSLRLLVQKAPRRLLTFVIVFIGIMLITRTCQAPPVSTDPVETEEVVRHIASHPPKTWYLTHADEFLALPGTESRTEFDQEVGQSPSGPRSRQLR